MGELGKRLYVERLGGIRNSCPLYTTISEASGYGGALPLNVGGVQCYAPLCPVGAGEAIGGYVERLGGVRMAIARTGIKPVDPPKPPEPPTPPPPQYRVLGTVRLMTNLLGGGARDIHIGQNGERIHIGSGEYYLWTTDFHPILPDGTKRIRISDATGLRNFRGHSGLEGLECNVPQNSNIKRVTASQLMGGHPYRNVSTQLHFHDISGKHIASGGILLFDMSHISNIANGFYKRRVLFDVTCLG